MLMRSIIALAFFLLALLLCPFSGWAAAISSAGSGDWATGGTWTGGSAPGAGDTFTIGSGHTVTVTSAITVGDAATAGTVNGTLTVSNTLTANGNLTIGNTGGNTGVLNLQAGSTLNMAGGAYNLVIGTAAAGTVTFNINGTSGSRVTLAGGTGIVTYTSATAGAVTNWNYATITGFTGAAGNVLIGHASLFVDHCLFNGNAGWIIGSLSMAGATDFTFTNNDGRNIATVANALFYFQKANAASTGAATISGNTFVGDGTNYTSQSIAFRGIRGFTLNNNVFVNTKVIGILNFYANTWDGNLIFANSAGAGWASQPIVYFGHGGTTFQNGVVACTTSNCHGAYVSNATATTDMTTVQDSIFEATWDGAASTANMLFNGNFNDGTFQRNFFLGATAGIYPCGDTTCDATTDTYINNNTFANFNLGGGATATKFQPVLHEGAARTAGAEEFNDNMVFNNGDNADNTGYDGNNAANDTLTAADYNAFYNITDANRYVREKIAGVGGNDTLSINPNFNEPTRTIAAYATANGGSDISSFFTEAVERNGFDTTGAVATFNSAFTAAKLLTYIQIGFTPLNTGMAFISSTGAWVGARRPVGKRLF